MKIDQVEDVRSFVEWFSTNVLKLRNLSEEDAVEQIGTRLQEMVSPALGVEVGDSEATRELVITAAGQARLFPLVRKVVDSLPATTGWLFVALKPPRGFEFTIEADGAEIDASALRFLLQNSKGDPGDVALRVRSTQPIRSIGSGVLRTILEAGLGEELASCIQHVDFRVGAALSKEVDGAGLFNALLQFLRRRSH